MDIESWTRWGSRVRSKSRLTLRFEGAGRQKNGQVLG